VHPPEKGELGSSARELATSSALHVSAVTRTRCEVFINITDNQGLKEMMHQIKVGQLMYPFAENMIAKSTPTEREVERICGIIDRDGTTYLLVEWQDSMSPEYVEYKNATPPMIEMMQKFLCAPRSKDTTLIKDESTYQQNEMSVTRYTQAQMNILEDSSLLIGMDSKTVHIKIE
ncbi:hypothetical protein CEXT_711031, partial [Caerostris extrusa]